MRASRAKRETQPQNKADRARGTEAPSETYQMKHAKTEPQQIRTQARQIQTKEAAMNIKQQRTMKRAGAWCIVFGTATIVTGVAVGVGCLIAAGKLLKNARS